MITIRLHWTKRLLATFGALITVLMKIRYFWDSMTCRFVNSCRWHYVTYQEFWSLRILCFFVTHCMTLLIQSTTQWYVNRDTGLYNYHISYGKHFSFSGLPGDFSFRITSIETYRWSRLLPTSAGRCKITQFIFRWIPTS